MHGSDVRRYAKEEDFELSTTQPEVEEPIEQEVETEVETEAPNVEETTEKTQQEAEPVKTEEEVAPSKEEATVTEEPAPRKPSRAENRIKALDSEVKRLQAIVAQKAIDVPQTDGELDMPTLQALIDNRSTAKAAEMLIQTTQQQLTQAQAEAWQADYQATLKEFPELDPKDPSYNKELDNVLGNMVKGKNGLPRYDVKVSTIVNAFQKKEQAVATKAREEGKSEASATLARQSQESAVTPTAKTTSPAKDDMENIPKHLRSKYEKATRYLEKPWGDD